MRFFPLLTALSLAAALIAGSAMAKTTPLAQKPKFGPSAGQEAYDCTFVGGRVNWITDHLLVLRDTKTNEVMVFDDVINDVFRAPIKATVVQDSASRLELDWLVKNAWGEGGSTVPVSFHVVFLKAQMKILEKAVVGGYDNKESRSGLCAKRTK